MKYIKLYIIFMLVSFSLVTLAQNEVDALRYSHLIPSGTSRYNAMAGSFGALGGDISVGGFNPAGLGVFRSNEITLTPSFSISNNSSDFLSGNIDQSEVGMKISNFGYLGNVNINNGALSNINFGFSYNVINDFSGSILVDGINNINSMTDWFANKASGNHYGSLKQNDNFYSHLAWESYIIDLASADSMNYVSAYDGVYGQKQSAYILRDGQQSEYNFSISANVSHKFFIGMSLGVQSINYEEVKTIEESDVNDNIADFNSFSFRESFSTRGSGLNFKFGFLYAPVTWIRLGGAIHTPTFYNLTDGYSSSIASNFNDINKSISLDSKYGIFEYKLNTPFKANGSLGFIISNIALINIDYEYIDYSKSKLQSNSYTFISENNNIQAEYRSAHNLKLGLEYRIEMLSLRAGTAYYGSPYASSHFNENSSNILFSGGFGIRYGGMFFDLAYSYITGDSNYYLYEGYGINSPEINNTNTKHNIFATIGFKF